MNLKLYLHVSKYLSLDVISNAYHKRGKPRYEIICILGNITLFYKFYCSFEMGTIQFLSILCSLQFKVVCIKILNAYCLHPGFVSEYLETSKCDFSIVKGKIIHVAQPHLEFFVLVTTASV
jgi:hypothetical protein